MWIYTTISDTWNQDARQSIRGKGDWRTAMKVNVLPFFATKKITCPFLSLSLSSRSLSVLLSLYVSVSFSHSLCHSPCPRFSVSLFHRRQKSIVFVWPLKVGLSYNHHHVKLDYMFLNVWKISWSFSHVCGNPCHLTWFSRLIEAYWC